MQHSNPNIIINRSDIKNFAQFSHDFNPLHIDETIAKQTFFGQTISHGILAVIKTLMWIFKNKSLDIQKLDVEFRRPVYPDREYYISCKSTGPKSTFFVKDETADALIVHINLRGGDSEPAPAASDTSWIFPLLTDHTASTSEMNKVPQDRNLQSFHIGEVISGIYKPDFSMIESIGGQSITPGLMAVMGLYSYIVGMVLPGLRSLFTRMSINFAEHGKKAQELAYQIQTTKFDLKFRMLENELTVCTCDGKLVATGKLKSYVRFCPVETDFDAIRQIVSRAGTTLAGKTALVIGGSRGLGADLSVALAFAGCRVYATCFQSVTSAKTLEAQVKALGLSITFVQGDAGDSDWCMQMRDTIEKDHGGLDILVLNAATPPQVFVYGKSNDTAFDGYISQNLKLVQRPLHTFLASINRQKGMVTAISSSFVDAPPKEFPQYVALKMAVEGMIQSTAREYTDVTFFLPRPPKLQTSWNDTPTGVLGTLPTDRVAAEIVSRMAGPRTRQVSIVSDFSDVMRKTNVDKAPDTTVPADFHTVVCANFTADLTAPGFAFWFRELDINGEVVFAPYNQILQELINPNSQLSANKAGINVVFLRIRDWLRELDGTRIQSEQSISKFLELSVQEFSRAMKTHRGHCKVETILVICPLNADNDPIGQPQLLDHTEQRLVRSLETLPGLTVMSAREFHGIYQVKDDLIHDPLREKIGHIPYQKPYFYFLATLIMRNAYRKMVPICKVVVVDCDNTLWKGVVGEVGADGLIFEPSHIALQSKLTELSQSGVVISMCSKNEEFDVWSVFDTRNDFMLHRDSIVSAMINWQPKSENIKKLAKQLNLGLDSFVFIDDNPVECAEVRAACPEVLTIQWPLESEKACTLLNHIWELDIKKGTEVDQKRTQMYKEELKRQEFMEEKVDFGDFLKSLELKTDLRDLNDEDLTRASQLTMRTNQFNFTTRRRKEGELKAVMSDDNFIMQTVRVSDRFGDYGLVGFYIGEITGEELVVDTFLLSCRVLGRGVEHYMLNELGRFADEQGIKTVRIDVFPTPRNTPARDFLKKVSPGGYCQVYEDGGLRSIIPSRELMAIELVHSPADDIQDPETKDQDTKDLEDSTGQDAPEEKKGIRSRAEQVQRTADDLSDMMVLAALIEGDTTDSRLRTDLFGAIDKEEISQIVYTVFSRELQMPVETLKDVDVLEDLGCDSFKIVEITVMLIQAFPWLPETLLFEHRSISDIIAGIYQAGDRDASFKKGPELHPGRPGEKDKDLYHDIAVIGVGVCCSGGDSKDALWDLLSNGGSAIEPVSSDRRYFLDTLNDHPGHWAGLMEGIDGFDADFFGISPREAMLMDPQTRIILETTWKSLEDAGYAGVNRTVDTGVYMGVMYSDYSFRANHYANETKSPYRSWETFSVANRVSHFMGFQGPSFTVDTACSSSGTALHLACRALRAQECEMAVAGGINLILDPNRFVQLKRLGILSPTGRCLPFCREANGVLLGEGAGVVVLKPLAAAVKDRDRIYGIIKGTALSAGTGSIGFTAPNPVAQSLAISKCIMDAGIDPGTVSYIETHGTGTPLGDPIEIRGLTLSYGNDQFRTPGSKERAACAIGSIKPNIGHLESAAAVLGLIKILLQFEHKTLAPSITSGNLNPKIPFNDTPFHVQTSSGPWERPGLSETETVSDVPRRAGLNSFGVGGANVHLIIEEPEADAFAADEQKTGDLKPIPQNIFTLSGLNRAALHSQARAVKRFLESGKGLRIQDICHTATVRRKHFDHRAAFIVSDTDHLFNRLSTFADQDHPGAGTGKNKGGIAFVFTGQGAQYLSMGKALYDSHPLFKSAMDECARILDEWMTPSLLDVIFAPEKNTAQAALIDQTQYTQAALFSIEYALSRLWMYWGITPDYVMGHSAGEIVALTAAGAMSLEQGLKLIHTRGKIMQALPPGGKMTAVRLTESAVAEYIKRCGGHVFIAAVNSPEQVVISGQGDNVAQVVMELEKDGVDCKYLTVSHAFHSALIDPMLEEYLSTAGGITLKTPRVPIVSCVDGRVLNVDDIGPDYWKSQVRDAVRFMDAMKTLHDKEVSTFIEMGPHPVLLGMGSACLPYDDKKWLPSLRKGFDDWQTLYDSLSKLYVLGADIDWRHFNAVYHGGKCDLPGYQFQHGSYWLKLEALHLRTLPASLPQQLENALYTIVWEKQSHEIKPVSVDESQTWLFLTDNQGVGKVLAHRFEQQGHHCIILDPGSDGYESRLEQVITTRQDIHGIGFFEGMQNQAETVLDMDRLQSYCRKTVQKLLYLIQRTIIHRQKGVTPKIWLFTRNAVSVAVEPEKRCDVFLPQSILWGFGRGLSLEHPENWGGLIDLSCDFDPATRVDAVVNFMLNPDHDQICFTREYRWVPRLKPLATGLEKQTRFSSDSLYLIIGGLGAIGRRVIRWMAAKGAKHLIVTGRKGMESSGAVKFAGEIKQAGADMVIQSLDTGDQDAVTDFFTALSSGDTPLKGIFHLAGIDRPESIRDMTVDSALQVLYPKVGGAWLPHQLSADTNLDFFVCFSSISSILGSEKRAHYAGANAFLDALVTCRRQNGLHGLCINWGPWKDGGMAGEEEIQAYSHIGNFALSPDACIHLLDRLLANTSGQVMVADIDWTIFSKVYEARRPRPLISLCRPGMANRREEAEKALSPWIEKIKAAPFPERTDALTAMLVDEICHLLGYEDSRDLSVDDDFSDIGIDSLIAVELAISIQKGLGLKQPVVIYDFPNITALAEHLLSIVSRERKDRPSGQEQANAKKETIVGYDPARENIILDFFAKAWPGRNQALLEPRWQWMYLASARRLGIAPQMWNYVESDTVIGYTGAIPVKIGIAKQELQTAWLVDTMILPSCRDKGLGPEIIMKTRRDVEFSLSLGQTKEMRSILLRLGWKQVAPLQTYVYPLNPGRMLKGKLNPLLATPAGAGFQLYQYARKMSAQVKTFALETRAVDKFTEQHDRLWNQVKDEFPCAVTRDASYLNWKYVDQPGQDFKRLEISKNGEIVAVAILLLRGPNPYSLYKYKRAFIVDLVTSVSDKPLLSSVLEAIRKECLNLKSDSIICDIINQKIEPVLEQYGFIKRDPTRYLLVHPGGLDETIQELLLQPENWLVTKGDSDIDRPEGGVK